MKSMAETSCQYDFTGIARLKLFLGLITVFAGYTAVYALNDVVGYRSDKKKVQQGNLRGIEDCEDLDAVLVRYPMARGLLSFKEVALTC
jgi:4-hydroxybenzoate polyprenyltransferase